MDEAAAKFLLEPLRSVLQEHAHLLVDLIDQTAGLDKELRLLQAKLMDDTASVCRKSATWQEMYRQVREAVYEIQDAMDEFVTLQASEMSWRKSFINRFRKGAAQLPDVGKVAVDTITKVVNHVRDLAEKNGDSESEPLQLEEMIKTPRVSKDEREYTVEFREELVRIIKYLEEEKAELDVISIIGMHGLGKTTLAYNIFNHPDIKSKFDTDQCCRIWVNVSHEYQKKDVLLSILSHFTSVTDNTRCKTLHDISKLVRKQLQQLDRFLIVMDDVWNAEVWTDLMRAFPNAKKTGKILITSQLEEVGECSNTRVPLKLRLLTSKESWKLLQSEALGIYIECPPKLVACGRTIAQKCGGLPLLILLVGKVLKRKCLRLSMLEKENVWESACANFSGYFSDEVFQNTSFYDKLPYNLRPCFLYLGIFPEGFEIPVRKLMRLWIVEGFIHKMKGMSLEQTALQYLRELINQNLVMIGKTGSDGHIKTCRVHLMIREFCRKEASSNKDNLLQEINYTGQHMFEQSTSNLKNCRRLCIDSDVNDFFSSNPLCTSVRSIMCFSHEDSQPFDISFIHHRLRFLRVLEAKSITSKLSPNDWSKLALLRYLVLSIDYEVIPKAISELQKLQTLTIYTTYSKLEIEANIWDMSQLRHLETNVSTKLPKPKKGKEGNQLQTLGMISHESCEECVFGRLRSLQKLGIDGQLTTLMEAKGLNTLHELEKLKLVNINYSKVLIGESQRLPFSSMLPPYLRSLTLKNTTLDWREVSTLGCLNTLEVLKLKKNESRQISWEESGDFCGLQVLHIEDTDLRIWKVSANTFPILRCLRVKNCRHLAEIPFSLSKSLQVLDLEGVTDSVVASASRIKEEKRDLLLNKGNTSGQRTEAPVPAGKFTTRPKPPFVELDSVVDSDLRIEEEHDYPVFDSPLRNNEVKHDLWWNTAKSSGLGTKSPVHARHAALLGKFSKSWNSSRSKGHGRRRQRSRSFRKHCLSPF